MNRDTVSLAGGYSGLSLGAFARSNLLNLAPDTDGYLSEFALDIDLGVAEAGIAPIGP
jgi:hypothetical protein